uniref:Putative secreted protein n=1 Tax=Anopheles darlingi TaxID=43151 RepID=A0A2M4DHH3_ANODA
MWECLLGLTKDLWLSVHLHLGCAFRTQVRAKPRDLTSCVLIDPAAVTFTDTVAPHKRLQAWQHHREGLCLEKTDHQN